MNTHLPPNGIMRFSWIVDKELAIGPAPRTYLFLKDRGFSAALNLQEGHEPGPIHQDIPEGFTVSQVPIRDSIVGGVPTTQQLRDASDSLAKLLQNHSPVYVHCFAGVGRSPIVCMVYLCLYRGMGLADAVAFIKRCHPFAAPNESQIEVARQLLEFPEPRNG